MTKLLIWLAKNIMTASYAFTVFINFWFTSWQLFLLQPSLVLPFLLFS